MLLGNFVAPVVMGLIFFTMITPTAIIMRMLGKDIINLKIKKSVRSYWIKRKDPLNSMEKQF